MATRMKLVKGDTRPPVIAQLTDDDGPIDLSDADTVIHMLFREEGTTTTIVTLTGTKLAGYDAGDGNGVISTSPYDVAGGGGRVKFSWASTTALANEPGNYEGEIQVTFSDATIQTVYDRLKFTLRDSF